MGPRTGYGGGTHQAQHGRDQDGTRRTRGGRRRDSQGPGDPRKPGPQPRRKRNTAGGHDNAAPGAARAGSADPPRTEHGARAGTTETTRPTARRTEKKHPERKQTFDKLKRMCYYGRVDDTADVYTLLSSRRAERSAPLGTTPRGALCVSEGGHFQGSAHLS